MGQISSVFPGVREHCSLASFLCNLLCSGGHIFLNKLIEVDLTTFLRLFGKWLTEGYEAK